MYQTRRRGAGPVAEIPPAAASGPAVESESAMAYREIDRKLRRRVRVAAWLACLAASAAASAAMARSTGPARFAFFLPPAAVLVLGHRWMADPGGVAVLVYHSVSADSRWLPWAAGTSVRPETFERHLRALREMRCNVVTTADLVASRLEGRALPDRPVVLHFDDGYLDNWVAAAPILARNGAKATVFVSTDFIESGETARPQMNGRAEHLEWSGYLNRAELKAMDSSGVMDVQSHGTDHGRVATGPRAVGRITPRNWRRHAWMQWAEMDGNKSQWFKGQDPPRVPYGAEIPESGPALACRRWTGNGIESEQEYESRVRDALERSRRELEEILGKRVKFFCWPYNTATEEARRIASEVGYEATTGGRGENRPGEDPRVISRITVHESVTGIPLPWLDGLFFRANVRLCHGVYYWALIASPLALLHRAARFYRERKDS